MVPSTPHTPFSVSPEMIQNTDAAWRKLSDGVTLRILFQDTDSDYHVGLIRYQPGASVPYHLHTGDEHIYILSGSQQDERGLYTAGSYIYNPQGTKHSVSSEEGCMVLVHWHKPVQFIAD
jgi:anti-sigma factor ChrR (cupin superfamily)